MPLASNHARYVSYKTQIKLQVGEQRVRLEEQKAPQGMICKELQKRKAYERKRTITTQREKMVLQSIGQEKNEKDKKKLGTTERENVRKGRQQSCGEQKVRNSEQI